MLLQDKLYVRAAAQYLTALDTYHTERNLEYETELLNIYRDGGMMNEYYGLIEDRIEGSRAAAGEYLALAQMYVDGESAGRAIPVLQQGIEAYQDAEMISCTNPSATPTGPHLRFIRRWPCLLPTGISRFTTGPPGAMWGTTDGRFWISSMRTPSCFAGSYAAVKLDGV